MMMDEIFTKGGVIVWVLAGYSFLALTLIIERLMHFLLIGRIPTDFERRLRHGLRDGDTALLIDSLAGPEKVLLQGILQASQEGIKDLVSVATRLGSQELQRMERGFRTLSIMGNTAPLLGLLGTIMGMIKAFMVIEQAGGRVDAQALAGGIWEAMLTTGVGLVVAIPVLLLLHLLEGLADRRAQSMRSCAAVLLEQLPHGESDEPAQAAHHRGGRADAV